MNTTFDQMVKEEMNKKREEYLQRKREQKAKNEKDCYEYACRHLLNQNKKK